MAKLRTNTDALMNVAKEIMNISLGLKSSTSSLKNAVSVLQETAKAAQTSQTTKATQASKTTRTTNELQPLNAVRTSNAESKIYNTTSDDIMLANSKETANSLVTAVEKAQDNIGALTQASILLGDVSDIISKICNKVADADAEMVQYIDERKDAIKMFGTLTELINVRDSTDDKSTKNDESNVTYKGKTYYPSMYEDYTYKDYVNLAKTIGIQPTLQIMHANGIDDGKTYGQAMGVANEVGKEKGKSYTLDDIQKMMGYKTASVAGLKALGNPLENATNNVSVKGGTTKNKTALQRMKNGDVTQANGNQYTYTFTNDFNNALDAKIDALLDNVKEGKFTAEEKAYLREVMPYIVKGVGASESSWSTNKEGYVGLTSGGLNQNTNKYLGATFKSSTYSTNISAYSKPVDGAEMSAAMLIHWADYYKSQGYSIDAALWQGQVSYCGGSSNAAYQLGMANDFYQQDTGNQLFTNGVCNKVVNNLSAYGVVEAKGKTQVASVTISPNQTNVQR